MVDELMFPQEMSGCLPQQRMLNESRVSGCHPAGDLRVLFLVADHRTHGGQAAGDTVQAVGDALAERKMGEGHEVREQELRGSWHYMATPDALADHATMPRNIDLAQGRCEVARWGK